VQDPRGLFSTRLDTDEARPERPVLIEALDGLVDAGNGRRIARDHLLAALDTTLIVSFDVDQLLDYRSHRPEMTYATDHWSDYSQPQIAIHLAHDLNGTPFLLLFGPEPDVQWERFIAAVRLLIADFDVRLVVGLSAIPMAVPHTRPGSVIAHGTPPTLIAAYRKWLPTVQVPASVGNLLEYRLGQTEVPACGFAVPVPYYLANVDYPGAARSLLDAAAGIGDLVLPTEALDRAADVVRDDIGRQIAGNDEARELVQRLEQQYDNLEGQRGSGLLADGATLPSADELAAEFERYLSNPPGDDTSN